MLFGSLDKKVGFQTNLEIVPNILGQSLLPFEGCYMNNIRILFHLVSFVMPSMILTSCESI